MLRIQVLVAVLCVGWLVSSAQATAIGVGEDVITNGGFEIARPGYDYGDSHKCAGWSLYGVAESADLAHSGSYYLNSYTFTAPNYAQTIWADPDGFAGNVSSLAFSGWIDPIGAGTAVSIKIIGSNYDGTTNTELDTLTLTSDDAGIGDWKQLTGSLPVRHGSGTDVTNYIRVQIDRHLPLAENFYADDFSLTTVGVAPEPAASALLATGLLALLAYAWRKRR